MFAVFMPTKSYHLRCLLGGQKGGGESFPHPSYKICQIAFLPIALAFIAVQQPPIQPSAHDLE